MSCALSCLMVLLHCARLVRESLYYNLHIALDGPTRANAEKRTHLFGALHDQIAVDGSNRKKRKSGYRLFWSTVLKVRFIDGSEQDVVVDSGAEESVCPWEWGERLYGTQEASRPII